MKILMKYIFLVYNANSTIFGRLTDSFEHIVSCDILKEEL